MLDESDLRVPPSPLRWTTTENRWRERLELVAGLIPPGASVLDLGSGAQGLRELVSGPYTPADLFRRSLDTLAFDMEEGIYPKGYWDVAVMAGVLEYATQPETVMRRIRPLADTVILTYQTVKRPTLERIRMDFQNHLNEGQIRRLCRRAGFRVLAVGTWQRQHIFRLT